MGALTTVAAIVRFVIHHALVEPVSRGVLRRSDAWPRHLGPVVALGLLLYATMTAVAVFAVPLRGGALVQWEGLSLPWLVVPLVVAALTLVLALAYAALLHVDVRARVPGLIMVIALATTNPLLAQGPLVRVAMVVEIALLVGFAVLRRRAAYSPWELVFAVVVVGHGLLARLAGRGDAAGATITGGARLVELVTLFTALLFWAVPAVFVAGAARAELTVSMASWGARGAWEAIMPRRDARPLGAAILGLLVVGALVGVGWTLRNPANSWRGIGSATVLLLVTGVAALLVLRAVPRGDRPGVQVDPDDLVRGWTGVSMWLAAAYAVRVLGLFPLAQLLQWWGISALDGAGSGVVGEALLLVGCVAAALWLARRARPAAAVLVVSTGLHSAYVLLANRFGAPLTTADSLVALALAALAVLAYALLRRRLSADRGLALASVLVIAGLFPLREIVDEPLSLLASISGATGGLLLGLLWRQLTEYGFTRRDSRGFPVASRVLLAVANLTLVSTAIAVHTAAAGSEVVLGLGLLEAIGDEMLGGSLLYGTCLAGLLLGLRGREGGDARAGEEFTVGPGPAPGPPPPDTEGWFDHHVERTRWR